MSYSVFNKNPVNHLEQFMFFGEQLNVARTETVRVRQFDDLTENQLGFFWRPNEIDLNKDIIDFSKLAEHEKFMFLSNLKYQSLLDSVQGRAPTVAFLPICSDPNLERWVETWAFSETIHSASYMHIIRTVLPTEMVEVFDSIVLDDAIMNRASSIADAYDDLIRWNCKRSLQTTDYDERAHKKSLYLCMVGVNILEAIRFYVSFAVTFSFGERKKMIGNADVIKLIARDEALHLKGTQQILTRWARGLDDPEMAEIAKECEEEALNMFLEAAEEEKDWATYLMSQGSIVGLNEGILHKYVDYITDVRIRAVNLESPYPKLTNPIPWISNWLNNVAVSPQESELTAYITGGLELDNMDGLGDLEL